MNENEFRVFNMLIQESKRMVPEPEIKEVHEALVNYRESRRKMDHEQAYRCSHNTLVSGKTVGPRT